MQKMPSRLFAAALAIAALPAAFPTLAQTYPSKPVRVIVGFPPGGGVDLTARIIQPRLSAALGQPVIIENRPGVGGMLAAELTSYAPPDGYTINYAVGSDLSLRPWISKVQGIDPLKQLTPIASAVESVGCIAVSPSLGVNSMQELLEMVKRNPGKLNFSSAGMNSAHHLTGELFRMQGYDMTHVPFGGLAPAAVAVIQGQVQVAITNVASVAGYVKDGKMKILALTRPNRFEDLPGIPTVSEALPGFSFPVAFYGFFGPPGLARPITARISADVAKALEAPEVGSRFRDLSMSRIYNNPEQFTAMLRSANETYGKIVKTAHIEPK
jgi:tripartite-type tricarboxylate transporter receptor subunit TctC